LRIAFLSYEFPPDTGVGGIATYVRQIATLLSERKVGVEVICASPHREETVQENEFLNITWIRCNSTEEFRKLSPVIAAKRHAENPVDMVEVPEYGAEGLHVKEHLPKLPLIVKLHTPKFLIKDLNDHYYNQINMRRIKSFIGLRYRRESDPEYKAIRYADHILSPSRSLIDIVSHKWSISRERILHAPNPYFPSKKLMDLSANPGSKTILYIGRLETRKGVYNLAKAVPQVVNAFPDARFVFLGKDSRGPYREHSMKKVMMKEMASVSVNVSFIDHVPLTEVHSVIAQSGICIFPSLWENFPNVCLEAMTAGRPIVASQEGGMRDMLEDINGGVFIDPHNPQSIARGIIELLSAEKFRHEAGERNREKAIEYYGKRLPNELLNTYQSFLIKKG